MEIKLGELGKRILICSIPVLIITFTVISYSKSDDEKSSSALIINSEYAIKTFCYAAKTEDALDEMMLHLANHDPAGTAVQLARGELVELDEGARVLLVDYSRTMCKVKIVSGLNSGTVAYVTKDFIKSPSAQNSNNKKRGIDKNPFFYIFLLVMATLAVSLWIRFRSDRKLAEERRQRKEESERLAAEECERMIAEELRMKHEDPAHFFAQKLEQDLFLEINDDVFDDNFDGESKVEAVFRDGVLGVESLLPNKDEIGRVKEVYYLKNGDERERLYSEREFAKYYENGLYLLALKSIESIFAQDDEDILTGILYNGIIQDYSQTTGKLERKIIMSVFVRKEQFEEIDLDHVDPKACFKALKGVSAAKLIDVTPVNPVLILDKNDRRFIEGHTISTHSGTNLASMDWQDFEQLVRQVLEMEFGQNGGEVKVTQASRDGGVDAVIIDPDPLRGGKIIVQAKRYTNTVPVSAVRDLYGTLINEGASSGILITTSDYGPDSYDFAKDKPLKLLNSGHLLALIQKNGMQGYIDLEEAKHLLKE